jgi:AraC-like DNA-binding protein
MPHKTINSYPSLGRETELPVFLRSVGCNEYQPTDDRRSEGYMYHQLYFIEEGELRLQIGEKEFRLHAGMGFFIPAHMPYCIRRITNLCTTHWLAFGCCCEATLFPMIGLESYRIYEMLDIKPLQMQLKKMYLLSTEDTFYSRCQNSALVYEYLMDVYAQDEKKSPDEKKEDENPALLLAKRYIEQYYFSDLTLDTLAEFAHVSPQHLCRLFQQHMQMRPTHYINLIRVRIAKRQLHNTDKTITEIAEAVGFHSPYYFTNTFKKFENMSPSAYRKLVKS